MIETDYLNENVKVLESLQKIPVFEPFEDRDLHNLLQMSKIRKYESGEMIIEEGQTDSWIYFLIYGLVKITKYDKTVVQLTRRGDVFGEMSFIDDKVRSASAFAMKDTACLALDPDYVQKLSGNEKLAFCYVLYRLFAEILADRLRQTTKQLAEAKGKSALKFWS
jgi:CRP-like cAMP-binding protein